MGLTIQTEPTIEPVSLADMTPFARGYLDEHRSMMQGLIVSARKYVENYTRRSLINTVYDYTLESLSDEITLPRSPVVSVTSITYVDTNGNTQTLSSSLYTVDTAAKPGKIYKAYNATYPSIRSQHDAVTVRFTAGYGTTTSAIPEPLKLCIKMLAAQWYDQPEPVLTGTIATALPFGLENILTQYRMVEIH
ncbi:hypothetical protein HED60_19365 [Planctomycetales bacterium ZRK34]|nr:hypothetical protein HED60_19365 [Planctomycetales bacterium ZRK34]